MKLEKQCMNRMNNSTKKKKLFQKYIVKYNELTEMK